MTGLELAVHVGSSIDFKNDISMNPPPLLPLVIEPPPLYKVKIAAVILHKETEPIFTQMAQTALH